MRIAAGKSSQAVDNKAVRTVQLRKECCNGADGNGDIEGSLRRVLRGNERGRNEQTGCDRGCQDGPSPTQLSISSIIQPPSARLNVIVCIEVWVCSPPPI